MNMDSRKVESNRAKKDAKKGNGGQKKVANIKHSPFKIKNEDKSANKPNGSEVEAGDGNVINVQTNQSHTTSILEMQKKLKEVVSPSSSKPDDEEDYYMENEVDELYKL